jgi:uncharacterized phage infection (PIP) family protein YhgE
MWILEEINRPRTVIPIMLIIIAVNGFLLYRYTAAPPSGSTGDAASNSVETADSVEEPATSQTNEVDYLTEVDYIQNGSVQTLASSNDKLLRYDALTPDDVAELQTNYSALAGYSERIENLDPPEGYEEQYELLSTAVGELYDAASIAYRVASDPVSASIGDFKEYERHVDEASASLRRSNELLGEDFETPEGLRLPTRPL